MSSIVTKIKAIHKDFQSIVASEYMRIYLKRIETNKKDLEAINFACLLMTCNDIILPAFSGEKRIDWIKQLKKAKKKVEKKLKLEC